MGHWQALLGDQVYQGYKVVAVAVDVDVWELAVATLEAGRQGEFQGSAPGVDSPEEREAEDRGEEGGDRGGGNLQRQKVEEGR